MMDYMAEKMDSQIEGAISENERLRIEVEQLRLAEEGAKEAFGAVVQQKRELEEEVKELSKLLAEAYKVVTQDTEAVRRYCGDVQQVGTANERAVAQTVSRMLARPPAA